MQKWEYRIYRTDDREMVKFRDGAEYSIRELADVLGRDGWELVTAYPLTGTPGLGFVGTIGSVWVFKRPLWDSESPSWRSKRD